MINNCEPARTSIFRWVISVVHGASFSTCLEPTRILEAIPFHGTPFSVMNAGGWSEGDGDEICSESDDGGDGDNDGVVIGVDFRFLC